LPVAGRAQELAQPYLLEGMRAREMLTHLQQLSGGLGGMFVIEDGKGILRDH
jgi:hypothetical protein